MSERFTRHGSVWSSTALLIIVMSSVSITRANDDAMVSLIRKAREGVVNIEARMPITERMGQFGKALDAHLQDSQNRHPRWYVSLGSGVVWNDEGYIVTTKSVVKSSDNIIVRTFQGDDFSARLIGTDDVTNIAVLKLLSTPPENLRPITHRSTSLPEGTSLVLMGYGIGGIPTISPGMAGIPPEDYDPTRHWFQFTASLRPGNSGSALIDTQGNLAGIALGREEDIGFSAVIRMLTSQGQTDVSRSQTTSYSSLGIGIPVLKAAPVVDQIIRAGRVVRGWIGVSVRQAPITSTNENALQIVRIIPGSPADDAGLKPGDYIRCVHNQDVTDPRDLGHIIHEYPPGSRVTIDFSRNDEDMRTEVTVSERPSQRDLASGEPDENRTHTHPELQLLDSIHMNN